MAVGGLASLLLALLWSGVVGPTWHTAQRSFHAQSQQSLASPGPRREWKFAKLALATPETSNDDELIPSAMTWPLMPPRG